MDISLFGYKFNIEILILIGVVYLILVGHTVCGCCNMKRMMEGLEMLNGDTSSDKDDKVKKIMATQAVVGGSMPDDHPMATSVASNKKEGFTGANINYGESSAFDLSSDPMVNTSSWSAPNMTVVPGQPLSQGVKDFLAREPQPVPLPEGEMLMFANTPFKPECCPNTYSNSSGCACLTGNQYNYLIMRGGNNTPYSSY